MLAAIPNPSVLLSPLTTQEAVLSSRIEGTQATMGEVLEFEAGKEASTPERREDVQEVLNYRAALRAAEALLVSLPLSQRVVREAHKVLLQGVRGQSYEWWVQWVDATLREDTPLMEHENEAHWTTRPE
jgi:Fic family protein